MSRAFDDYYIEDCGVILALEVTQRRTDNNDQFVILATLAFNSLCKHTLAFLFKQKRIVVRV
jgi:hypothetical protein